MEVECLGTWGLEMPTPSQGSKGTQKPSLTRNPAMSPAPPHPAPAQAKALKTYKTAQDSPNTEESKPTSTFKGTRYSNTNPDKKNATACQQEANKRQCHANY